MPMLDNRKMGVVSLKREFLDVSQQMAKWLYNQI